MADSGPDRSPPAAGATRSVLATTVELDRSALNVRDGARTALGVLVPLLVGIAIDRPLDGAVAAGGAFCAGFAVFASGYRTRVAAVLVASLCVAASTFVGAAVGDVWWLLAAVVAVWGFAAGMLTSLGMAAGIIGVQSVIGLLVITQYEMPIEDAAGRAGLIAVGGVLQALLVVSVWPLRRSPFERRSLAAVYRTLGDYARSLPAGAPAPPDPLPFGAAWTALGDPQPFSGGDGVLVFQGLSDEAERLRTTLAALAHLRPVLAAVPARARAVTAIDELAVHTADLLDEVALAIERPRPAARTAALLATGPAAAPGRWARLAEAADRIGHEAAHAGPARGHLGPSLLGEVDRLTGDLLSQLEAVARLSGEQAPLAAPLPARSRSPLGQDAGATLRAHLTLRSPAFRHAVRLGVTLGVGTALAGLLPFEHRYWLPLTALVVLRPDFTSTFSRGLGRIVGTVLGAVIATGLAVALQPGPYVLAFLVALTAWAGYSVLFANYGLYGLAVTCLVVFLLAFSGLPSSQTVLDRVEATVLGGALALVAYAIWPTWERVRLPEQLARLLEAQERYGTALLVQYSDPEARDLGLLQDLRATARLARTNAEASIERVRAEPAGRRAGLPLGVADEISAATRRYALAALALQAHLSQSAPAVALPIGPLAAQQSLALRALAGALRTGSAPDPLPPLRETQQELREALRAGLVAPAPGGALDAAVLDVEADQLVGSALAVAAQLQRPAAPAARRARRRARPRETR